MGVSFGEVTGEVRPDEQETPDESQAETEQAPRDIEAAALRRLIARLDERDARLRAT